MDMAKVDLYMTANARYFPTASLARLRKRLEDIDNDRFGVLQTVKLTDPTLALIVSILFGYVGIDRLLLGQYGLGVGKLLTVGGLGFWYLIDLFLIFGATKKKNYQSLGIIVS
ncbi:TM2 domain-containing protein [bacterium]|nr:TM2 domain-containing protein [bacterium]